MPTRAQAETALIGPSPDRGAGRVGKILNALGVTATGESPVAALSDTLAVGLIACGVTPADITEPGDDDFANLSASQWLKLLDIAELQLLETAVSVNVAGKLSEQWEDYRYTRSNGQDVATLLQNKRDLVRRKWGYGGSSLTTGTLRITTSRGKSEFSF